MPVSLSTMGDISGKRVLVRASLNVPLEGAEIRDTKRIDDSLATIEYLHKAGAKITLISHLSGGAHASLKPVAEYLSRRFPIMFVEDILSLKKTDGWDDDKIILCENIRRYPGEEKNDMAFAQQLAARADMYVNDDFTSTHRNHASVVTVPTLLPSFMGVAFEREYTNLFKFIPVPAHSMAIIGGAKPETKLPLVAKLVDRFETVYVGGISANTVFEDQGHTIGRSKAASKEIPDLDGVSADARLSFPSDLRILDTAGSVRVGTLADMESSDNIVDAGPQSVADILARAKRSAFVIWNGPLGDYEHGFGESTTSVARELSQLTIPVVIGGGDTLAATGNLDLAAKFAWVSDAGGAMLHLFAYGNLPGVEALERGA